MELALPGLLHLCPAGGHQHGLRQSRLPLDQTQDARLPGQPLLLRDGRRSLERQLQPHHEFLSLRPHPAHRLRAIRGHLLPPPIEVSTY